LSSSDPLRKKKPRMCAINPSLPFMKSNWEEGGEKKSKPDLSKEEENEKVGRKRRRPISSHKKKKRDLRGKYIY